MHASRLLNGILVSRQLSHNELDSSMYNQNNNNHLIFHNHHSNHVRHHPHLRQPCSRR